MIREQPSSNPTDTFLPYTTLCRSYGAGRPNGPWCKWKRDPLTVDCVLMYAQRGHGKRSSYYSDYTFGCWRDGADRTRELVPVGKAYFGFTGQALAQLDRYVRNHTVERFGPVARIDAGLVLEDCAVGTPDWVERGDAR